MSPVSVKVQEAVEVVEECERCGKKYVRGSGGAKLILGPKKAIKLCAGCHSIITGAVVEGLPAEAREQLDRVCRRIL